MKNVIFKFSGGPLDGATVSGPRKKDPDVRRYYALTHHGRVGQRFRTASEYAVNLLAGELSSESVRYRIQQHVYEVADRIDNGNVLFIRVVYVT